MAEVLFCTTGTIRHPDFSASLKLPAWNSSTPSPLFRVPSGNITSDVPSFIYSIPVSIDLSAALVLLRSSRIHLILVTHLRRIEKKLTQVELSRLAGVSLGSLKRFEQTGNISLNSLIKIAFVLDCQEDFDSLFAKKGYSSIQEVIDEQR